MILSAIYNFNNIVRNILLHMPIDILSPICYNNNSERGSEVMQVNATELIASLIEKLEKLVRENERLKLEIEQLKSK